MAKELLLIEDVDGLGRQGEIVKVADGYARNFLLPKNKAEAVNAGTKKRLAKLIAEREARDAATREEADKLAARLEGVSVNIPVKVGDEQQLYGSVSATDISEALSAQGVEIDKHAIQLDAPLKELGAFDVAIKIHADLAPSIKVWVVEE